MSRSLNAEHGIVCRLPEAEWCLCSTGIHNCRWSSGLNQRYAPEAVQQRCAALKAAGADGAYFFNFCCYGPLADLAALFRQHAAIVPEDRNP